MKLIVWFAACTAILQCVHTHCSVKRAVPRSCALQVNCFGVHGPLNTSLPPSALALPASCSHSILRLELHCPAPPLITHCPTWSPNVFKLQAAGKRWKDPPSRLLTCLPMLQMLDLPGNLLVAVPTSELRNLAFIRSLDLSSNLIRMIPVWAFSFSLHLERLLLSQNLISTIVPGTFSDLISLEMLDLSNNALTTLHRNSFYGLVKLNLLRLNNNQLVSLDGALMPLHSLQHLFLRNNALHSLSVEDLPEKLALLTIDISNNRIIQLQPEVLSLISKAPMSFHQKRAINEPVLKILLSKNKIISLKNSTSVNLASPSNNNVITLKNVQAAIRTEIDISANLIEKIEFNALAGIEKITYLDLGSNKLKNFIVNTTNLKYLTRLILKNNRLFDFKPEGFYGLTKLVSVDISGNKIYSLPQESTLNSSKLIADYVLGTREQNLMVFGELQQLDASNNKLVAVNLAARQFGQLQSLLLASNRIADVADVRLQNLLELNELDLNSNKITFVSMHSLAQVPALKKLHLARNFISDIQPGAFKTLLNLVKLDLSANKLTNVDYGMFTGLERLEELTLAYNNIKKLDSRVLYDLKSLSQLDLEENVLTELDLSIWKGNRSQITVQVGGNKLSCSWLADTLTAISQGVFGASLVDKRDRRYYRSASSVGYISCEYIRKTTALRSIETVDYDKLFSANKDAFDAMAREFHRLISQLNSKRLMKSRAKDDRK